MTHPVIDSVIDLAAPIASELGLEVVAAVFQTNQNPPVLRVDVRNLQQDTGLDDCERMSRALEAVLDQSGLLPDAYVLEVSSPGISRVLESDREFISFKGFSVTVMTSAPVDGQVTLSGNLVSRDPDTLLLNRKGRVISIPRAIVTRVQLDERKSWV
ncbi:MAG: ribosome maturation factor RimP [Synechococcales bacterium]|nr:ribosome maturation factor RimP [Synechococcales bacterium]